MNDLGSKHWIGFKPQAVAGTPETTVNTFLLSESAQMLPNHTPIERKTFAGTGQRLPSVKGWIKPSLKCTAELAASQPHPFFWWAGAVAATTPTAGVKLHTITEADEPVSLTAEGDLVVNNARQGDVRINKIKLSGKVGEIAHIEIEALGCSHEDGATLTSVPVFVTDPMTVHSCAITVDGEVVDTIEDFEIELDNMLEQKPTLVGAGGGPQVVRRKEMRKRGGKFKYIDFPSAELAKLANADTFAVVVELRGALISDTYYNFLCVTLPCCQYSGGLEPEASDSVITGSSDFEAFYDVVTGRALLIEAQNTVTDITV